MINGKIGKAVVKYFWPPAVKLTINACLLKNYFNILGKYLQLLLIGVGTFEVAQIPDQYFLNQKIYGSTL